MIQNKSAQIVSNPGSFALAIRDIVSGIRMAPLWIRLGWNDVAQKYRRSLLGPFWLTASMAIMVISLGVVYSQIFKVALHDFMPFLCVGLLIWGFISTLMSEAGALFTGSESYIKQIKLPFSLYVYRFVWSRTIIFAHNFVIYFGILLFFQINPGLPALMFLPGFILLIINGAAASTYLGMISARFRDIPQIINSLIQILFFVTPIMWKPDFLGRGSFLVNLNPFFHLIEIARAPLLGYAPSTETWLAALGITVLNLVAALAFFTRFRSRISYWI